MVIQPDTTFEVIERHFHFINPATTSRGTYHERIVWFVVAHTPDGRMGIGECAPLPDLSCDFGSRYGRTVKRLADESAAAGRLLYDKLRNFPSVLFGLETALLNLQAGSLALFDTPFSRGEEGILINGLVWMGNVEQMLHRLSVKISEGYHCVKLKIGSNDTERELSLIESVRSLMPEGELEIRVDANGAYDADTARRVMERLAACGVHSIEQPVRAGQPAIMGSLCRNAPLPIALDEELIGVVGREHKASLLDSIAPQYIILKPTLHGGIHGCQEWIDMACERGIGFWVTSALESNIGLNAIAQWCATQRHTMPQGLGTGLLYSNNVDTGLHISDARLHFSPRTAQ